MTARHIVLVASAVAVLGLGVYLYVAVNSTSTAVANVRPRSPAAPPPPPPHDDAAAPPEAKAPEEMVVRPKVALGGALRDTAAPIDPGSAAMAVQPGAGIDLKKDELMASANKAYDHGEFDEAMTIAKKVLATDPSNTRMLRILVSASCILGDSAVAQQHYLALPPGGNDRADMKKRCDRYGVTFSES